MSLFNGSVMHKQPPFGYQTKCYEWLRMALAEQLAHCTAAQATRLQGILTDAGCWGALAPSESKL